MDDIIRTSLDKSEEIIKGPIEDSNIIERVELKKDEFEENKPKFVFDEEDEYKGNDFILKEANSFSDINISGFARKDNNLDNSFDIASISQEKKEVIGALPADFAYINAALEGLRRETGKKSAYFMAVEEKVGSCIRADSRVGVTIPDDVMNEYYEAREAIYMYLTERKHTVGSVADRRRQLMDRLRTNFEETIFDRKIERDIYKESVKPLISENGEAVASEINAKTNEALKKIGALTSSGDMSIFMASKEKIEAVLKFGSYEDIYAVVMQFDALKSNLMAFEANKYSFNGLGEIESLRDRAYARLISTPENKLKYVKTQLANSTCYAKKVEGRYNAIIRELGLDKDNLSGEEEALVNLKLAISPEYKLYVANNKMTLDAYGSDESNSISYAKTQLLSKNPRFSSLNNKCLTEVTSVNSLAKIGIKYGNDRLKKAYRDFIDVQQGYADYMLETKLATRNDELPEATVKKYDLEAKVKEFAREGRTKSYELINDYRQGGDSSVMVKLKKSLTNLETLLGQREVDNQKLDDISIAYQTAIANCNNYIEKHPSPHNPEGKRRLSKTRKKLDNLIIERARFEKGREIYERENTAIDSLLDIVKLGDKETRKNYNPIEDMSRKNITAIQSLTLEDFMSMIGEHNRGGIIFKDGELKVVENSAIRSNKVMDLIAKVLLGDEAETVANVQIREKLLSLIEEQYGAVLTQAHRNRIKRLIDLDAGKTTAGSLKRDDIASVFNLLDNNYSLVNRTRRNGKTTKASKGLAEAVANHMDDTLEDKDLEYRIKALVKNGEKSGVKLPSISDHNMAIIKTNFGHVRDEVFKALQRIYTYMGVFNKGKVGEDDYLLILGERERGKNIIDAVTGYVIARQLAGTKELKMVKDKQLDAYLKDCAYKALVGSNKMVRADARLLEKCDKVLDHKLLSENGSSGLQDEVDRRILKTSAWKNKSRKVKQGTTALIKLCDMLSEYENLRENAINRGLSTEEAEQFKKLGSDLQAHITADAEMFASMKLVAKELTNTRFKQGFEKIKKFVDKHESFLEYADFYVKLTKNDEKQKENENKLTLMPTELENYAALSDKAKDLVRVFKLERSVDEVIASYKDKKSIADGFIKILEALRGFLVNSYAEKEVEFGNEKLKIVQLPNNTLSVIIENRPFELPKVAGQVATYLENSVMKNASVYGKEHAKAIFDNLSFDPKNEGVLMNSRNLCIRFLAGMTGKADTFFNNLATNLIRTMTSEMLKDRLKASELIKMVDDINKGIHFNGQESIELLENLNATKEVYNYDYAVEYIEGVVEKKPEFIEVDKDLRIKLAEWNEDELKVKDFIADLIFSSETWNIDQAVKDEDITTGILEKHFQTIMLILKKPTLVKDVLKNLPAEGELNNKELEDTIDGFLSSPEILALRTLNFSNNTKKKGAMYGVKSFFSGIAGLLVGDYENFLNASDEAKDDYELMEDKIKEAIKNPAFRARFKELQRTVQSQVDDAMEGLQSNINVAVNEVFDAEDEIDNEVIGNPNQKGISDDERTSRIERGHERLGKIVTNAFKGGSGQGLFNKNVLSTYFARVSNLDKRAMIASALRNANKKTKLPKNLTAVQQKKFNETQQGRFLGGLIKGAGPLLQKMMQGMPSAGMPVSLKEALKDVKSKLAPIPKEFVEAQLHGIINASNGKIKFIRVNRALGAASVAQTFLCTIYGPDFKGGKEVAIKILRPEVKNRMDIEKEIMLDAAKLTDRMQKEAEARRRGKRLKPEELNKKGGMEATYEGQLKRIEEEMDLRIEAKNAQRGMVYDRGFTSVKSVKVDNTVEPTTNTLVLEKASGDTIDTYLEGVDKEVNEIVAPLINDSDDNGWASVTFKNFSDYKNAQKVLPQILKGLQARHEHMEKLVDTWVREGVFGEGFYHGDMHAGNIMIDENGVTVIDFGNVTQLDDVQRDLVLKMMIAASCGDMPIFLESFGELLTGDSKKEFNKKKSKLKEIFKEILGYGDARSSGLRIVAALMKAQAIGVELPAAIYNFSQSQIRLQNAMDDINARIKRIQKALRFMDKNIDMSAEAEISDYYGLNMEFGNSKYKKMEELIRDQAVYEGEDETELREKLHSTDKKDIAYFENNYIADNGLVLLDNFEEFKRKYNIAKAAMTNPQIVASENAEVLDAIGALKKIRPITDLTMDSVAALKAIMGSLNTTVNQEVMDSKIQNIEKNSPMMPVLNYYKAYREAQRSNASEEELMSIENELVASLKKLQEERVRKSRGVESLCNLMPLTRNHIYATVADPNNPTEAEKSNQEYLDQSNNKIKRMLAEWESQKHTYGEKLYEDLRNATDAVFEHAKQCEEVDKNATQELKDKRALEEKEHTALINKFAIAYRRALVARLKYECKNKFNSSYSDKSPASFADAMGDLLLSHLSSSASKLGFWGIVRNVGTLSKIME